MILIKQAKTRKCHLYKCIGISCGTKNINLQTLYYVFSNNSSSGLKLYWAIDNKLVFHNNIKSGNQANAAPKNYL